MTVRRLPMATAGNLGKAISRFANSAGAPESRRQRVACRRAGSSSIAKKQGDPISGLIAMRLRIRRLPRDCELPGRAGTLSAPAGVGMADLPAWWRQALPGWRRP